MPLHKLQINPPPHIQGRVRPWFFLTWKENARLCSLPKKTSLTWLPEEIPKPIYLWTIPQAVASIACLCSGDIAGKFKIWQARTVLM